MVLGAPVRNFRGRNLRMRIARPLGLGAAGPRRDSGFDILVILRNIRRPACVSPVPRLASATAPRALRERVTHATPVETRERSRGHGPVHGRVQLFHSLATPATTISAVRDILIRIFERLLYAPTRESGRDPRIDTTATRNIPVPPPRSGTRMRKVCAMSAQTARPESTRPASYGWHRFSAGPGRRHVEAREGRGEAERAQGGGRPRLARVSF